MGWRGEGGTPGEKKKEGVGRKEWEKEEDEEDEEEEEGKDAARASCRLRSTAEIVCVGGGGLKDLLAR